MITSAASPCVRPLSTMQRFAKELVAFQPDLILTSSTPATAAMLQQTRTIPIIFVWVADPVGKRLRREPAAAGRQRDRFHPYRGLAGRQVGGG